MKQWTLQWLLFTVGGALVGAVVVDYYRNYKADQKAKAATDAKPDEIVILEKL